MIHQENRGHHESSSAFGQFIHNTYPTKFWFGDLDGYLLRLPDNEGPGSLRLFEIKKPGGNLSAGQKKLLPILAQAIPSVAKRNGFPEAGVFCLQWANGKREANVTRFNPDGTTKDFAVEGEQFDRLVQGLPSIQRARNTSRLSVPSGYPRRKAIIR
jgi:hypothetical protein